MRRAGIIFASAVAALTLTTCIAPQQRTESAEPRFGDEIVVCGRYVRVGTPVVLWTDPGGYSAYRPDKAFAPPATPDLGVEDAAPIAKRYGDRRAPGDPTGRDFDALRRHVDQFVIHYDAAGTSRSCFRVLHDVRGLSVHFMLDLDGTIYQTLDLRERAFHATIANDRSIGIEIANIGAYDPGRPSPLDRWYARGADGVTRLTLPPEVGGGGLRSAGPDLRPARPDPVVGEINGSVVRMYDLTPAQYAALEQLTTALTKIFPRIEPIAPRGPDGRVLARALTPDEFQNFRGVLGHWHVQANKVDPGPAFQWDLIVPPARRGR